MNIDQLLKQNTIFKDSGILAGAAGLENDVTSVMVLEAADVENWGHPGQLLLTSFYALQSMNTENTREFIRRCHETGISGIAVKIGRLISEIPEDLRTACDEFGLPLITMSAGTKYETVILSIMEPLILQMAREQARQQKYSDLTHDLLNGRIHDIHLKDQALNYLKIDRYPRYQVILISCPGPAGIEPAPDISSAIREAAGKVRAELLREAIPFAFLSSEHTITLILNTAKETSAVNRHFFDFLTPEKEAEDSVSIPLRIAMSETRERPGIPELFTQAQDILSVMHRLGTDSSVWSYDDLGIYRLFLKTENRELLMSLPAEKHVKLRRSNLELWETLETFVSCGQNYLETAKRLYLHPKTVKYRISKLQEQLSLDFSDSEEVFRILLDARLFRFLEDKTDG